MNNGRFRKIIFLTLAIVLGLVMMMGWQNIFAYGKTADVSRIDDWYYINSAGELTNISLPHKLYQNDSGVTEIHTVLNDDFTDHQSICFWTFYQCVEVFVGGESVYKYNNSENGSFGIASSPKWNIVDLHEVACTGDVLTLKMHTPYEDINVRMTEVVTGSRDDIDAWLYRTYGVLTIFETVFIAAAVFLMFLSVFQNTNANRRKEIIYSGITFILFTVYLRTGTKCLPIYWLTDYVREFCCYFCLLCLAIPFTLFVRARAHRRKKMVLWLDILLVAQLVTDIVIFALHFSGKKEIHYSVGAGLALLFISVMSAVVFSAAAVIRKRSSVTIISLVSSVIITIVMFTEYLQFYQLSSLPFDTGMLSHLGAAVVITGEAIVQGTFFRKYLVEKWRVAEENKNLQLRLLTSQIKPHFLLNTVGAIRTLIHDDPDRASDLLYEFSKYFRKNLEQKDYAKPVPFPVELDYINTYLKLECARFGDKIRIEYDIDATDFWVLPLTIQPFVENAVKHGLFPAKYAGVLKISTRKLDDRTVVTIEDNGVGFDVAEVEARLSDTSSVGIKSAVMRLEKGLGGKVTMKSTMQEGNSGSCIIVEIPHKRSKNK